MFHFDQTITVMYSLPKIQVVSGLFAGRPVFGKPELTHSFQRE